MKRIMYIFVLSVFMLTNLSAEINYTENEPRTHQEIDVKFEVTKALENKADFGGSLPAIGGDMKEMPEGTFDDATFSNIYDLTPIAYEPKSGTIFVVSNFRFSPEEGAPLSSRLVVYYSQDNGQTWDEMVFAEEAETVWVYPSIAVLNPTASSNIDDMIIYVFTKVATYDAIAESYPFTRSDYFIRDQRLDANIIVQPEEQPSNTTFYQWGTLMKVASYDGPQYQTILNYGTLSPQQDQSGQYLAQYGVYGVGSYYWETVDGNLADFGHNTAYPDGWEVGQFRTVTSLSSSYNSTMYVDFDENGNAYAGVFNLFADDIESRVPGISKSTDFGETWSTFERCPASVIDEFYLNEGGTFQTTTGNKASWAPGTMAYGTWGFVVTGQDEYSFIVRFNVFRGEDQESSQYLVEIAKKEGAWSVRKIADVKFFASQYRPADGPDDNPVSYGPPLIDSSTDEITEEEYDYFFGNPRHLEIQASKTSDNSGIVVKFIDEREESQIIFDPPFEFTNPNRDPSWNMIDTTFTTDIVMGYRSTDGDWNVGFRTNTDNHNYKQTWIPNIVESFEQVPLMTSRTMMPTNPEADFLIEDYPRIMTEFVADNIFSQQGLFGMIDLTDPTPINDPYGLNSVEIKDDNSFEIRNIYPNPATDNAEVVFNTNAAGSIELAIYDALGNKVQDVLNSHRAPGMHVVVIDNLQELTSGAYFITMTFDGQRISKPLNIVR